MFSKVKRPKVTIEAVVYRANGQVEVLGELKSTSPAKKLWRGVKKWLRMM